MAKRKSQPASYETRMLVLALGLLVGFVLAFVLFLSRVPVEGVITHYTDESFDNGEMSNLSFDYYEVLESQRVARRSALDPAASTNSPSVIFVEPVERNESATNSVPSIVTQTAVQKPVETHSKSAIKQLVQPTQIQQVSPRESVSDSYFIETGNYQNNEDALQAQARLGELGLQAFVVVRQDASGNFGHRVRIGPILEQAELDATRSRLRASGIKPTLIRVKG